MKTYSIYTSFDNVGNKVLVSTTLYVDDRKGINYDSDGITFSNDLQKVLDESIDSSLLYGSQISDDDRNYNLGLLQAMKKIIDNQIKKVESLDSIVDE